MSQFWPFAFGCSLAPVSLWYLHQKYLCEWARTPGDAPLGLVLSIPNDTSRGSSSKHGRLSEAMAPPSCVCLLYSRRQELIVQSHAVRDCAVNMHKIRMLRQYRQSAARGASLDSWMYEPPIANHPSGLGQ